MYNWNVDLEKWKKKDSKFIVWKLNQLINFGLNGEKLDLKIVKRYWSKLSLDPKRKKFLKLLIWQTLS
ncbi:MAG: hypothetical protein HYT83_03320 [Candidatus Levybacteria bacterium]|nr:hypothetical protein [Candidatus Levybacteria bacterium]